MKAFDEWWKKTAHPNFGACEYRVAQSAWNAALLHAAEVADKHATWSGTVGEHRNITDLAARLRKEVGDE